MGKSNNNTTRKSRVFQRLCSKRNRLLQQQIIANLPPNQLGQQADKDINAQKLHTLILLHHYVRRFRQINPRSIYADYLKQWEIEKEERDHPQALPTIIMFMLNSFHNMLCNLISCLLYPLLHFKSQLYLAWLLTLFTNSPGNEQNTLKNTHRTTRADNNWIHVPYSEGPTSCIDCMSRTLFFCSMQRFVRWSYGLHNRSSKECYDYCLMEISTYLNSTTLRLGDIIH